MNASMKCKAAAGLAVLLVALAAADAAKITQKDGAWQVTGETYQAVVDAEGNFRSLIVDGVEFLGTRKHRGERCVGGDFPGAEPAAVRRDGNRLVASRDKTEVVYTFGDDGFTVKATGGVVAWWLSKAVTALVAKGGAITPAAATGDVHHVVAGRAAVRVDPPHHYHWRLFPRRRRGDKGKGPLTCRFTCGVTVRPVELIHIAPLRAAGTHPKVTAMFAPGQTPQMELTLKNLAEADAAARVRWTVRDHPHDGEQVAAETQAVAVPAGKEEVVSMELRLERPGPYWVHAALLAQDADKPLQRQTLGIIYDANSYKPPLTRPDDFEAFWDRKLAEMRKIPFDAKLEPNAAYATRRYVGYNLEITGHDGKRMPCVLMVPRAPGPHDAEVGGSGSPERVHARLAKFGRQPAGVGMWQRGDERIHVGAPSPKQATFRDWNGRDDNNMLHCYLQEVRLADYLRSRDDVSHIWLFGASRGGPIALAAAALAPEKVAAVNVHVPTCCGISWKRRPYRGWGHPPSRTDEGLKTAAYFDPVNFAPDLKVPVVMDGGIYDGLSPIPGMLAFINHATNAPFARCSIEQGHHGYFTHSGRKAMEEALAEHLKAKGIDPDAETEK
jgi:cephalosporin-C deacetylase